VPGGERGLSKKKKKTPSKRGGESNGHQEGKWLRPPKRMSQGGENGANQRNSVNPKSRKGGGEGVFVQGEFGGGDILPGKGGGGGT